MTLVHFHLTDAEGRGLDGSVSLVPTRRVTVADAIRLPVAQTVRLTAGEATAEVMPSTTQWAWRASELVAGGIVRYVEVPDKESAEYSGLADVDPKTLDQSSETVAAWELVTRAAQGVLDRIGTIDDKVQSAAASAAAAKASETRWPARKARRPPLRQARRNPPSPRRPKAHRRRTSRRSRPMV